MSAQDVGGQELYVSRLHPLYGTMQRIAIVLAAVILLGTAAVPWVVVVAVAGELEAGTLALVIAGMLLVEAVYLTGLAAALSLMWRSSRMALVVTTQGVIVRGCLRTHHLPWQQIRRIDSSRHWYWRRATEVVTTSGRRIIAIATSYQYILFRPEPFDALARDPAMPLEPTRVAIDAHQRHLRGEFGPLPAQAAGSQPDAGT